MNPKCIRSSTRARYILERWSRENPSCCGWIRRFGRNWRLGRKANCAASTARSNMCSNKPWPNAKAIGPSARKVSKREVEATGEGGRRWSRSGHPDQKSRVGGQAGKRSSANWVGCWRLPACGQVQNQGRMTFRRRIGGANWATLRKVECFRHYPAKSGISYSEYGLTHKSGCSGDIFHCSPVHNRYGGGSHCCQCH